MISATAVLRLLQKHSRPIRHGDAIPSHQGLATIHERTQTLQLAEAQGGLQIDAGAALQFGGAVQVTGDVALTSAGVIMAGGALQVAGDLVLDAGVGITAVRTACPAVGVPDYTGDITTFRTPGSTTLADLDVSAAITTLRSSCDDGPERVYTEATFDVLARRTDTRGARTVTLPYFSTVLRGGSSVVTKRVGQVTLQFADGQERATATGKAGAFVNRADASLPADIREKITRRRRAGDPDAHPVLATWKRT